MIYVLFSGICIYHIKFTLTWLKLRIHPMTNQDSGLISGLCNHIANPWQRDIQLLVPSRIQLICLQVDSGINDRFMWHWSTTFQCWQPSYVHIDRTTRLSWYMWLKVSGQCNVYICKYNTMHLTEYCYKSSVSHPTPSKMLSLGGSNGEQYVCCWTLYAAFLVRKMCRAYLYHLHESFQYCMFG